jgi:hypothetical protein
MLKFDEKDIAAQYPTFANENGFAWFARKLDLVKFADRPNLPLGRDSFAASFL